MELEFTEQQRVRLAKVEALREAGIEPYPTRSARTHTSAEALARFEEVEPSLEGDHDTEEITVAGRVMTIRDMGRSIFAHIEDGYGRIQIYLRKGGLLEGDISWFSDYVDRGDFIEARGKLFRTRTGEITLEVAHWTMLSKAISPPPEKWHGLQDVEERYRRRYVDLFSNPEVREVFRKRSRMITALRAYLDRNDFLEVETPTLQPVYGGALARPFTTYHNELEQTLYLRIADELYLKRLIVGGFERVYEICKDFRNEGVDRNHQPEFTMLEFYIAYADYDMVMKIVEEMVAEVVTVVTGGTEIEYQGELIDFKPPWRRLSLADAIFEETGIDFNQHRDQQELYRLAKEAGAEVEPDTVWPKIVDELLKTFVRPKIVQPTFLVDYPVELSPLAKRQAGSEYTVERFQPMAARTEIGNGYSELNDPLDQFERFKAQVEQRKLGDDEAMPVDIDYVEALMYGMPPTGGFGLGVDRMAMLLTNQRSIREVILFPAMRRTFDVPEPAAGAGGDEDGNDS
ncbi:MAG TPA: lysine--tRNA ligase [Thermomicrobiales bacterium]|nr:lysine--tRNA ligase [Thermomicrobiales bacterium]